MTHHTSSFRSQPYILVQGKEIFLCEKEGGYLNYDRAHEGWTERKVRTLSLSEAGRIFNKRGAESIHYKAPHDTETMKAMDALCGF